MYPDGLSLKYLSQYLKITNMKQHHQSLGLRRQRCRTKIIMTLDSNPSSSLPLLSLFKPETKNSLKFAWWGLIHFSFPSMMLMLRNQHDGLKQWFDNVFKLLSTGAKTFAILTKISCQSSCFQSHNLMRFRQLLKTLPHTNLLVHTHTNANTLSLWLAFVHI